jgi:branched-chain amino acid transport system permease protein
MTTNSAVAPASIKSWIWPGVLVLILATLAAVPKFSSTYILVLFISIFSYIVLTVAWVLFSGPTGYISLAPAAFFGIGMYMAAMTTNRLRTAFELFGMQMPFTAAIALAAFVCFLFALLVGSVTLRLRGIYFTIFTFGLVLLIQQLLTWWEITFTHTRGRFVVVVSSSTIYYHMLGILVLVILAAFLIRRSKFGLALQSIGQDEDAAAHAGVNVTLLKVITFAVSALFMGAAGAAVATRLTYIDPGSAFSINYSFFPVLMAIFGGMSNLVGPIVGAAVFAYLEETLTTRFPYWYMLIFGLIMVIVIAFLPAGLVGLLQRQWRRRGVEPNGNS